MQLKSHMTEEQVRNDRDPLFLTCHPLGKLKMIATIISNESCTTNSIPFETFRPGEVYAISEIIDAAVDEIQFLVDITQEQFNELEKRMSELEGNA
ncbi:hypothetical protein [uncultured Desulfobacter sp.]|uniref:hypothetical protein n=1 Tax=uncultured Desulfobacter sp. TaxID=240139 RepID=UPI0029F5BA4B|nr:hypothetical protein [uncultured Desulfobacter sp.]